MSNIFVLLLITLCLFRTTKQLSCFENCWFSLVADSQSFIEPKNESSCVLNSSVEVCIGQIKAYYIDNGYPKFINYSFGNNDDELSSAYVNDVLMYGLTNFTKYQVVANAKSQNSIVSAEVFCQNQDDCVSISIKELFSKYNRQKNPLNQLKDLIYANVPSKNLKCFTFNDSESETESCNQTDRNAVCIAHLMDLNYGCSSSSDIYVDDKVTITWPPTHQITLWEYKSECNKDHCNNLNIVNKIQNITYQYAQGNVPFVNSADNQPESVKFDFLDVCFMSMLMFFSIF